MVDYSDRKKFQKELGNIIQLARIEKGLSSGELSTMLGYEFDGSQMISKIERGVIPVPKDKIGLLVSALGLTGEVLGLDPNTSVVVWIATNGKSTSISALVKELL